MVGSRASVASAVSVVKARCDPKHLRVLAGAGLVRGVRQGRESLFALERTPFDDARRARETVAQHWEDALKRLKALVEK